MSKRKSKKKTFPRNWYLPGALLVIVVIVVVAILLNKQGAGGASATQLPYVITVQDAYQKYQEGVFILDVREPSEWDEFHIPNTTLIPLGELPDRLDEVPQGQPIIVVCRSGNRSQSGQRHPAQCRFSECYQHVRRGDPMEQPGLSHRWNAAVNHP